MGVSDGFANMKEKAPNIWTSSTTSQTLQARGQSPSQIAALRAVTKSSPTNHGVIMSRRDVGSSAIPQHPEKDQPSIWAADETPIPPTNALVKMFESHIETKLPSSGLRTTAGHNTSTSDQTIAHSEDSYYAAQAPAVLSRSEESTHAKEPQDSPGLFLQQPSKRSSGTPRLSASTDSVLEKSGSKTSKDSTPPPPPRPSTNNRALAKVTVSQSLSPEKEIVGNSSESSHSLAMTNSHPPQLKKMKSSSKVTKVNQLHTPTDQLELSKPHQNLPIIGRGRGNGDSIRMATNVNKEAILLPYSVTPQLTANSLANAMVASSIASSRAHSPSKPMHPPPRQRSKSHLLFPRSHSQEMLGSRTPSPGKAAMRQTMRETLKSDNESERRIKSSYMPKKHPNKHHEGDRKKWRDQITEHERKRYEGVWAANKSLFLPNYPFQDPESAYAVVNLVVRDIWLRSRLPNDVLRDIWDLVDSDGAGRLTKDEFVVGMWLIDQRLKGRKLPVQVSESVWSSARRLSGIKVPGKH